MKKTKNNIFNVYIREIPFEHDYKKPICEARLMDINQDPLERDGITNYKYFGWRLLEIACKETLGVEIETLNPRKLETGKWVIDNYYISLSNSGSYVMCGISNKPIGVDIQKIKEIAPDYFVVNEMCKEEIEYYKDKEYWEHYWEHVEKEAVYKCYGTGPMEWKKINTLEYKDKLYSSEYQNYFFTVCSDLISEGFKMKLNINAEEVN